MSSLKAAGRVYAEALFSIGVADGTLTQISEELHAVRDALDGLAPDVARFFELPQLPRDEKWRIVQQVFGDQVGRSVLGLLHVLIDRRRELLLDAIVDTFDELDDERAGRVQANVVTARPLGEELVAQLKAAIEQQIQREVVLHERVDATMIGGIRVSLGDVVVDGTLRRSLADMRRSLAGTLT